MDLPLSTAHATALRRAALNGEYQLLLGAGASLEAKSAAGPALPGSGDLALRLSTEFSVPLEEDDQLWRIYARAVSAAGNARVYAYLRSIFWNSEPPVWMDKYARFMWDRVWTLNLDDTFENTYSRVRSDESRRLTSRSWDDEFVEDRTLSVIHLHGSVESVSPRELVFSLAEYSSAIISRFSWPLVFRDAWGTTPFVVVGARLRDEPDIETVIAGRRPGHSAPSIYVSPRISAGMRRDLCSWGLVPFEGTAEQFGDVWAQLTGIPLDKSPSSQDEISFRVGRQFVELRTNRLPKLPPKHDFVGGDPPKWNDIVENVPAKLDWIRQGKALVERTGQTEPVTTALIFSGPRLSGRSAGLLELCRAYIRGGWRVFLFRANERIDVDALLRFTADGKSVALAFDGIADVADDVDRLLKEAREAGISVTCLAVENSSRAANLVGRIRVQHLRGGSMRAINARLTRTDSARLVDKLAELGRLGILERRNDYERVRHFRGRELFGALSEVENAPAFGRRVAELVTDLEDSDALRLCLFATSADKVERPLLVTDAARMLGIESETVLRLVKTSPTSSLLTTDGYRVIARQRFLALPSILAKIGAKEAMELLNAGVRVLSNRAGQLAHRERNATVMLVGALMSYRNLVEIFPGQNLERWYTDLSTSFGSWSGRFWEQRAIMSRHLGQEVEGALARAESYAERAVTLAADAYAYTTLGTVLCARAVAIAPDLVEQYYDRAFDAFERAGQLDRSNIVTWFAYLRAVLPLLERLAGDSERSGELLERVSDDWMLVHEELSPAAARSDDIARDLSTLRRRFDEIALNGSEVPRTDAIAVAEDVY